MQFFTTLSMRVSFFFWTIHQTINGLISWLYFKHLHHHTFSSMLANVIFKAHHAWILSCFNLGVGVGYITWLIFPTFWLFSLVFFTTLQTWLILPHFSTTGLPWCVCTHPIDLMDIHLLCCAHGNEHMGVKAQLGGLFGLLKL
jgi:hypothetical protein